jgi:hypothetical protein
VKEHPWVDNAPKNNRELFLGFMMFSDQVRFIRGLESFDDEIVSKLKEIFEIASPEDAGKLTAAAMQIHAKVRAEQEQNS